MSIARRIPYVGGREVEAAPEKLGQAVELELPAGNQVVERIHGGPAKFAAELNVVTIQFPREIVEKLIIGIHAVTRVGKR